MNKADKASKVKWPLGRQMFLISLLLVILAVGAMGISSAVQSVATIKENAQESMQNLLNMEKAIYEKAYPGEWKIFEGQLYKGFQLMNDNHDVSDSVFASTGGYYSTLFLGDVRIATSLKDGNGNRMTGTNASKEVSDAVLKRGETYLGEADIMGRHIFSAYEPIRDKEGNVLGMIFIGDPTAQGHIDQAVRKAIRTSILIGLVVVAAGFAVTWLYSRTVTRRIGSLHRVLEQIAAGDLTAQLLSENGQDELTGLSRAVNRMNTDLREMVLNIHEASHQMAASAEELSASSQETSASTEHVGALTEHLAENAEDQLHMVRETGETLDEMTARIGRIATLSADVNAKMDEAETYTRDGYTQGRKVLEQMRAIKDSNDNTFVTIEKLEKRSQEIGGIASAMANISKQTNMLALNAAIEASRAGESGRGFAVVAGEIRKLAEQSAESAGKVGELVEAILGETGRAAKAIHVDREAVTAGVDVADRVSATFSDIQTSFDVVNEKMREVSTSLETLRNGGEQITEKMARVKRSAEGGADATQQVAATCQEQLAATTEIAGSAQALANLADGLQNMLQRFKL